ncbi:hypothetical protein CC78DRAFT_530656, partial [Lojkania enalia]
MQYSSILLALFAASGSMALPKGVQTTDNIIEVTLGTQKLYFTEGARDIKMPHPNGPFDKVALKLSSGVDADYRCQITDENDKPIVLTRGTSIDDTFGDGNKGAWNLRNPTTVKNVICDPTFQKISPAELKSALAVRVQLGGDDELAIQVGDFTGKEKQVIPVRSSDPFKTVQINVGKFVENQDIRCKVKDEHNRAIKAKRGDNEDFTFSDAGKGLWNFIYPAKTSVSKVICDPKFKSL